ncbi:MAG: helix-turn-helix domain-containing protein [Clostridia bacterium]|nr:helix-turn-helix domain-containing protein [Clostridia bacterium]
MQQVAELIRQRRKELGLTQAALAERIHVSAKAVSKWERAGGLPDASIIPSLADALGMSAASLLHGRVETNPPDGGNMKRIKFYQCPGCGNILTATGKAELSCCGRQLTPMTVTPADDAHRLSITDIETEKLLSWTHPMEKSHHLTFLAAVGYDCVHIVRLYPEGAQEQRLPRIPWAKYYCGCTEDPSILHESKPKGR